MTKINIVYISYFIYSIIYINDRYLYIIWSIFGSGINNYRLLVLYSEYRNIVQERNENTVELSRGDPEQRLKKNLNQSICEPKEEIEVMMYS